MDRGLDGLLAILIGNLLIAIGFTFLGPIPPFNFLGGNLWLTVLSIGLQGLGSAATFLATLLYMMKSTADAELPDSEQTRGMVSSFWVVSDCAGGFIGSALGSVAFDILGFRKGTMVMAWTMVGTVAVIGAYFVIGWVKLKRRLKMDSNDVDTEERTHLLREENEGRKYGSHN